MPQSKFTLKEPQMRFLTRYEELGYRDRSELVRVALDRMAQELAETRLRESAQALADLLVDDKETREWVEDGMKDWPA